MDKSYILLYVLLGIAVWSAYGVNKEARKYKETMDRLNQFLDEQEGVPSKNDPDIPDDLNNDIFVK